MKTEPKNDLSEALNAAGASAPSLMPPVSRIEHRVRRRKTARTAGAGLASVALLVGVFAGATRGNDSVANEVAGEVETAEEIVPTETASTAVGANVEGATGDERSEDRTTSSDSTTETETDIGSALTQSAEDPDPDTGLADTDDADNIDDTNVVEDSTADSDTTEPEGERAQAPLTSAQLSTTTTLAATTTTAASTTSATSAAPAPPAATAAPAEATLAAPSAPPTVSTTIADTEVAAAPVLGGGSTNTIPREADSRLPFDPPLPGSDGNDESPAPASTTTTTPAQSEPEATPGSTTGDPDGSDSEEIDPEPATGSADDPATGDAVLAGRVIRRSGNCMPVIDGPRTTCLEEAAAGVEVRIYAAVSATASRNAAGLPAGASPVAVATTDADGRYSVTLPLGSYSVFVPDPEGEAMACSRSSGSVACPISVVAAGATYSPVIDAAVY